MTTFIRDGRSPSLHVIWAGRVLLLISVMVIFSAEGRKTNHVRCIERERQALLNFKRGLKDYYNTLSSWTSNEEECCTWRGIKCDNQTNHVVELDFHLWENYRDDDSYFDEYGYLIDLYKFSGEIGSSLTELIYLKSLDFRNNRFTKIPNFIGAFTKLRYLSFDYNPISGKIPSQLGNLTSLSYLSLRSDGQMTADDLDWLSHLPSLTTLHLQNLTLTKPVNWLQPIKEAPSLSSLELYDCGFPYKVDTSSISHINSSNSLRDLDIGATTMHSPTLPWLLNVSSNLINLTIWEDESAGPFTVSIGNSKSLQNVFLIKATQGGIPISMGNLCNLRSLGLQYSNGFFNGTLQDFLESLSGCATKSLEILVLEYSGVRGSLPDLSQFSHLRELHLSINNLSGNLSKSIGELSNLELLDVSSNYLTGSISEGHLQNLSKLQYLDLSSNNFTGVVSGAHLKKLSKLRYLDLSSNSFTLHFDSKWIPPFQLVEMKLRSCKLDEASFPTWLQTQLKLSVLDISNTGINTDAIPDWFYNLTPKLRYLNLSSNSIKTTLLKFPLRFDNYATIDLSSNQFHGPIPLSLANATVLNLYNNTFTIFQPFLCAPTDRSTTFLDLSFNMLFGSLPNCWMHWENLQYLDLGSNKLYGNIPGSLGLLYQLQTLILRQNNFSGSLPSSLKNCTSMEVLDIGKNNLNGGVPKWIGERLSKLALLSLKSNSFQGTLPSSLCYLVSVQSLDLSLNNISGTIPSCFRNFTSMATKQYELEIFTSYGSDPSRGYGRWYGIIAYFTWKGQEYKFDKTLGLLRLIDLSSNILTGHIPRQLTDLVELKQLNLSRNNLSGTIPDSIRQLLNLDSLDLSHNQLSGKIPTGLAYISFLGFLDLSDNHLRGKIPTGTQLQTFDASTYSGNTGLYGPPLQTKCPEIETLPGGDERYVADGAEWFDMSWFYMGLGVGFSIAFLGVIGWALLFNNYRPPCYFRHLSYKLAWQ